MPAVDRVQAEPVQWPEHFVAAASAVAAIIAAALASWKKWRGSQEPSNGKKNGSRPDQIMLNAIRIIDGLQRENGRMAERIERLELQRDEDESEIRRLRLGGPGVK